MSVSLRFDHDGSLKIYTWKGQEISLNKAVVDAIREYFARPKPSTPRERAQSFLDWIGEYSNYHLASPVSRGLFIDKLIGLIEDAARRGVDWEEDNGH